MTSIQVIRGATLIIIGGPSNSSLQHSLFDERIRGAARKCVEFYYGDMAPAKEPHIIKLAGPLQKQARFTAVIAAAIRKNPQDPEGGDWLLWAHDGGAKMIIDYSSHTRTGSAKMVEEFPKYW